MLQERWQGSRTADATRHPSGEQQHEEDLEHERRGGVQVAGISGVFQTVQAALDFVAGPLRRSAGDHTTAETTWHKKCGLAGIVPVTVALGGRD